MEKLLFKSLLKNKCDSINVSELESKRGSNNILKSLFCDYCSKLKKKSKRRIRINTKISYKILFQGKNDYSKVIIPNTLTKKIYLLYCLFLHISVPLKKLEWKYLKAIFNYFKSINHIPSVDILSYALSIIDFRILSHNLMLFYLKQNIDIFSLCYNKKTLFEYYLSESDLLNNEIGINLLSLTLDLIFKNKENRNSFKKIKELVKLYIKIKYSFPFNSQFFYNIDYRQLKRSLKVINKVDIEDIDETSLINNENIKDDNWPMIQMAKCFCKQKNDVILSKFEHFSISDNISLKNLIILKYEKQLFNISKSNYLPQDIVNNVLIFQKDIIKEHISLKNPIIIQYKLDLRKQEEKRHQEELKRWDLI
jgi:uncharacterized protein YlaI